MKKTVFGILALALAPFCASAVDGVVLINQSTVMAAGGFPYNITQPGSYKLSGNLTVPDANTTAINIGADNVTLDLNGFSISGPTVCTGFPVTSCSPLGNGKAVDGGNHRFVTVVNGIVRGMGGIGIVLASDTGGSYVEKVNVHDNGDAGIRVANGKVSGNNATSNGGVGIVA